VVSATGRNSSADSGLRTLLSGKERKRRRRKVWEKEGGKKWRKKRERRRKKEIVEDRGCRPLPVPPQLDPLVAWVLLLARECRTVSVPDANVPVVHAGDGELALPVAAARSGRPMLPSRVLLVAQARHARLAQPAAHSVAMKNAAANTIPYLPTRIRVSHACTRLRRELPE
jgi:hypothetical protein